MARGSNQTVNSNNRQVAGSSSASMEDSESPFYLHNGDHPSIVLVSHILTRSLQHLESIHADGSHHKEQSGLCQRKHYSPRSRSSSLRYLDFYNSMVIPWILNFVSRQIAYSLLYMDDAFDVWIDFRDRLYESNGPQNFQIKK